MNRAEMRRRSRGARRGGTRPQASRAPLWIMSGAVLTALTVVAVVAGVGWPDHHPTPRPPELQSDVVPAARYGSNTRTARTYQIAAAIPTILDGLYCYCRCDEHSGHRSLLDCFASDHASACDVCMREAEKAYEMTTRGEPLDRIRDAIDRTYAS